MSSDLRRSRSSTTSATAVDRPESSSRKKVKAGSNWKKLQKTLTPTGSTQQRGERRRSLAATSKSNDAQSHTTAIAKRRQDHLSERNSSSPAPTSLPWFAEDLSAEDLALVRGGQGERSRQIRLSGNGEPATALATSSSLSSEEAEKRRRAILGGDDTMAAATDSLSAKAKAEAGKFVAIDCEMVGVGPKGSESMLARVSIVNWHGAVLLDTFVQPREQVTDYRTWVSGVRASDLRGAPSFAQVQGDVAKLIEGKVLVGHALQNDLRALLLSHPHWLTRDTASYAESRKIANTKYPSLRKLVALRLGIEIQQEGAPHSSVEDARATMALYRTFHDEWQKSLAATSLKRKGSSSTGAKQARQIIGPGWKANKGASADQSSSSTATKKRRSADDAEWWKTV